jgi:hypothetical protein
MASRTSCRRLNGFSGVALISSRALNPRVARTQFNKIASLVNLEGKITKTPLNDVELTRGEQTRERSYRSREAAFKAEGIGGIRCMGETPQKKMKRLSSEADMRYIVSTENN